MYIIKREPEGDAISNIITLILEYILYCERLVLVPVRFL